MSYLLISAAAAGASAELELAGMTGLFIIAAAFVILVIDGIVDAWRYRNWRRALHNRKNPKWWEK